MTTTPTNPEDKTPRERGRQTCRAAYMAVINIHHAVELCDLAKERPACASLLAEQIVGAATGLAALDGLCGDISGEGEPSRREMGLAVQLDARDMAATQMFAAGIRRTIDRIKETDAEYRARILSAMKASGGFTPRTEVSEVKPAYFSAADRYIAEIASGPTRDFVKLAPGEPEKVGAAAMPREYAVYPGSYEDSILKACAAIAVTAVNRHEARMSPRDPARDEADRGPSPELLAFRRWCEGKVKKTHPEMDPATMAGEALRAQVDADIEADLAEEGRLY